MVSTMYGGLATPNSGYSSKYTSQYSSPSNSYSSHNKKNFLHFDNEWYTVVARDEQRQHATAKNWSNARKPL